jgi:nucleoside-diphosphate-sugar epimerase
LNKIIITGANSYIASVLLEHLKNWESEILLISRKSLVKRNKNEQYLTVKCDISRENPWSQILKGGETIIHLASQNSLKIANNDPLENWRSNVKPIYDIADACKKIKEKPTVIFTSTVTVFGLTSDIPVNENHPESPTTIYDLHKLTAERLLKYFNDSGIMKTICLRLSNVYGPGCKSQSLERGILDQSIKNAIKGLDLLIYQNGNFTRDFIFVDDVIRSILIVCEKGTNFTGKSYIISTGKGTKLMEVFQMIKEELFSQLHQKTEIKIIPQPDNLLPIEKRNFVGSFQKFHTDFKWKPQIEIVEGIRKTVHFYSKTSSFPN